MVLQQTFDLSASPTPLPFIPKLFDPTDGLCGLSRLREYYCGWFYPQVLVPRKLAEGTIASYLDAIHWWERLMYDPLLEGDPPLHAIDASMLAKFEDRLKQAHYTRSQLKGAKRYRLSGHRIKCILNNVRAMLARAGQTQSIKEPCAGILPQGLWFEIDIDCDVESPPVIDSDEPLSLPKRSKRSFLKHERLNLIEAVARIESPRAWGKAKLFYWRAFLAVLFYTGVRVGTAIRLHWEDLQTLRKKPWLKIPGARVSKTRKKVNVRVHPLLLIALEELRTALGLLAEARGPIFPRPCCRRRFRTVFDKLQKLAGITDLQGWHAWRRTHARLLARLGANLGRKIAQASLDHFSSNTTEESYVKIANELIPKLPWLWGSSPPKPKKPPSTQRPLFD